MDRSPLVRFRFRVIYVHSLMSYFLFATDDSERRLRDYRPRERHLGLQHQASCAGFLVQGEQHRRAYRTYLPPVLRPHCRRIGDDLAVGRTRGVYDYPQLPDAVRLRRRHQLRQHWRFLGVSRLYAYTSNSANDSFSNRNNYHPGRECFPPPDCRVNCDWAYSGRASDNRAEDCGVSSWNSVVLSSIMKELIVFSGVYDTGPEIYIITFQARCIQGSASMHTEKKKAPC